MCFYVTSRLPSLDHFNTKLIPGLIFTFTMIIHFTHYQPFIIQNYVQYLRHFELTIIFYD